MSDVFYLRPVDPPTTPEAVLDSVRYAGGCFDLHRVDWTHSFLAADGRRMLCWYRAPDAESARVALRDLGAEMSAVWPGRVIGGVEPRDAAVSLVDVLAEVALDEAPPRDDADLLARLARAASGGGLMFGFAFLSNRRDRLVCLLRGGDAGEARSLLEGGGFPRASAWLCTVVTPGRR